MPVFSPSSCSKTSLRTVVGFARTIIGSSSRSEIRSLLVQLTDALNRTSQAHDEDRSHSNRSSRSSNNGFQRSTERFPWVSTQYQRILQSAAIDSQQTGNCNGNDNSNGNDSKRSSADNPPLSSTNATYGETPPATVSKILNLLSKHNGNAPFQGQFVDAGSGRGGVVICAALEGIFPHCRGIEYDLSHSQAASSLQHHYNSLFPSPRSSVRLVRGDLSDERFHGASVVYSNCVVFDSQLVSALGCVLDGADLQPGAFVVTATRRFSLPSFDLVDVVRLPCNGGEEFTFYVSQKRGMGEDGSGAKESVPAVSDSEVMGRMRDALGGDGMEELAMVSLREGGEEGLSFLTALGGSETNARLLAGNLDLLELVGDRLSIEHGDLKTRAGASMALRAMAAFPAGRRSIAEHRSLLHSIFLSLGERRAGISNDHLVVRANLVDILGQVLHDHVGNEVLGGQGVDLLIEHAMDNILEEEHGSDMLRDACEEVKSTRQWRSGTNV